MKTLILTLFLALVAIPVLSQTDPPALQREIVLRSDRGLVYKWETAPNRLWRLSGVHLGSSLTNLIGRQETRFHTSLGLALGRETRVPVTDRLDFLHGPQIDLLAGFEWWEEWNLRLTNFSPGLTYLLGALYHINEDLYLGFEGGPSLSTRFRFQENQLIQSQINAQFSTYQLQFTLGYRFPRFPAK